MPTLDDLKNFDVAGAELILWVFKKSITTGRPPRYTGRWLDTTGDLDSALKEAVVAERDRIEEVEEYGLLSQNNEASALSIGKEETYASLIVEQSAAEVPQKKVRDLRKVLNSDFYVIKLVSGDSVIHAVRKTDSHWSTRKARNVISVIFSDDQLDISRAPRLDISRQIDFFIVGDEILISNKPKFESVLNYKQAHREDFATLQAEPEFASIFETIDALVSHVGENKIQLRRASAIRQKGHYKDPNFMARLRANCAKLGLNIQFDGDGRIISTPETCRDIMQALLDHRLASMLSQTVYDVPDARAITV